MTPASGPWLVLMCLLGSVYIWNAHALPRKRPLARRATPRILDVSPRSVTRRAAGGARLTSCGGRASRGRWCPRRRIRARRPPARRARGV
ncbi:hypothetical protein CFB39_10480 [Burkholderia sp. AU6039]|nr:hypothetical protein CFB39_10480 [Burkholderia sp. AU6039]